MNDTTWQRLFGFRHAFDHPVTVFVTLTAAVLLALTPLLIFVTTRAAKSAPEKRKELWDRSPICQNQLVIGEPLNFAATSNNREVGHRSREASNRASAIWRCNEPKL
jgi:hypothetical protein